MPEDIELLVDGKVFAGWLSAGVSRAMDAAAGTYSLSVTDRWSDNDEPWELSPGDACEVRVGGEVLITGYIDIVRPGFGPDDRRMEVQGRDKSGDMVDCSAIHKPDHWKSIGLLQLAQTLAKPFGITVKADTDLGAPLTQVKLQQGETALEAINRHAKMRKVLVMPDGKGGLLLTRTGTRKATVQLVEGRNIAEADGNLDWSERYSEYVVKGQAAYSAKTDGKAEAHAAATAKDPGVTRYRPLLVVNDGETNAATAKDRATWEANTRIGKSAGATITVVGWRETEGGPLWQPNTLVLVESKTLQISGEMLIRQVTYTRDEQGTRAKLELVSPQTYEAQPPNTLKQNKRKKAKGGGSSVSPWAEGVEYEVKGG